VDNGKLEPNEKRRTQGEHADDYSVTAQDDASNGDD
jgi:hypothetical protein